MSNSLSGNETVLFGPEPNPGDRLGNYILDRKLGSGGMGHVWKAIHEPTRKPYAIKLLPPIIASNPDAWDQVRRNFDIIENLNHPHICAVKVLDRDPKYGPYLVMAHVEGMTLNKYRQGRTFTPEQVAALLKPVAEALDFAHSRKVIHRDIKHENIMVVLADDGQTIVDTYVIDFGLAAESRTVVTQFSQQSAPLAGTLRYMAPELWRGRPPVPASDQYALAVIAYELFAGYFPIDGVDRGIMREAVLNEAVEPISGMPAPVNEMLLKAMAKKPEERFETCAALLFDSKQSPMPVASKTTSRSIVPRVTIPGRGQFETLKEAVAAAKNGDKLLLEDGMFEEAVEITCSISISPKNPASRPVLQGSAKDPAIYIIEGARVNLTGLVIRPPHPGKDEDNCPVVQAENSSVSIEKCEIAGLYGSKSKFVVSECIFADAYEGIHLSRSQLQATSCEFRDLGYGIKGQNSEFRGKALESLRCDHFAEFLTSTCVLTDSTIQHGGVGLHVSKSNETVVLERCTFEDCERVSIRISGCSAVMDSVRIHRGGEDGISLFGANTRLHQCEILECRKSGLSVNVDKSIVEASECNFSENGKQGVSMSRPSEVTIRDSTITENRENGISYSGVISLENVEVTGNRNCGISSYSDESSATVVDCDLRGNKKGNRIADQGNDYLRNTRT